MAMNLTVNHFPGGPTGHFNITIGGKIDGVEYKDLTIGSNIGTGGGIGDIVDCWAAGY